MQTSNVKLILQSLTMKIIEFEKLKPYFQIAHGQTIVDLSDNTPKPHYKSDNTQKPHFDINLLKTLQNLVRTHCIYFLRRDPYYSTILI